MRAAAAATDWFASVAHAESVIEAWRREYNEERPKKGLGRLTPADYGRRLIGETSTVTAVF
jgi:transposase InsO family protein